MKLPKKVYNEKERVLTTEPGETPSLGLGEKIKEGHLEWSEKKVRRESVEGTGNQIGRAHV